MAMVSDRRSTTLRLSNLLPHMGVQGALASVPNLERGPWSLGKQ